MLPELAILVRACAICSFDRCTRQSRTKSTSPLGTGPVMRSTTSKRRPLRRCSCALRSIRLGAMSQPRYSISPRSTCAIQKKSPQGTSTIDFAPSSLRSLGSFLRSSEIVSRLEPLPDRLSLSPHLLDRAYSEKISCGLFLVRNRSRKFWRRDFSKLMKSPFLKHYSGSFPPLSSQ